VSIALEHLVKRYDDQIVVHDVSLEVAPGELFVLLGPSGSGKSTVLRIVAGLVRSDMGRVRLHGRDVTAVPPQRRGVGFVFQAYALFRHMSVADNVEFALRVRKVPRAERARRRDDLLDLVGLAGLGARYPDQLSGGQQQRVALARALAHRPEVLLLDEPFGALDARIRAELRGALREIQRELKVTALFVTHDQEEAFELGDRMGVMSAGRLLEVGPPGELYLRPRTEFVATFLGRANLADGRATADGLRLGGVRLPLGTGPVETARERRVRVMIRPEDVAVRRSEADLSWPSLGPATVATRTFHGSVERLAVRLDAASRPSDEVPTEIEAARSQHQARRFPLEPGDRVWVGVRRIHALTYPGVGLVVPTDGADADREFLRAAWRAARVLHARVAVLGWGSDRDAVAARFRDARELGSAGLADLDLVDEPGALDDALARELRRRPYDVVVVRARPGEVLPPPGADRLPILAVPARAAGIPRRARFELRPDDPIEESVLPAAHLLGLLGVAVTLVPAPPSGAGADPERTGRHLVAAASAMERFGLDVRVVLDEDEARDPDRLPAAGYDLLAPAPGSPAAAGPAGAFVLLRPPAAGAGGAQEDRHETPPDSRDRDRRDPRPDREPAGGLGRTASAQRFLRPDA